MKLPSLAIVVPCYNEEEVLTDTSKELVSFLETALEKGLISSDSYVYFVDDGSKDRTWQLIEVLAKKEKRVQGIKLSRNRGHQNALLAGLLETKEDVTISIDADLQDDTNVMFEMLKKYHSGNEIVYGVRNDRQSDTAFKKWTAELYYRLLEKMGVEIVFNHADFRLMSRVTLNSLDQYDEVNLFLRGMIPQLGYKTSIVEYARKARLAGESKYPVSKMLKLAWQGITSFSNEPIRYITKFGFAVSALSLLLIFWVFYTKIVQNGAVPGWASTLVPILFISGVQLVSVGILGEYIGKIYSETKRRPRYHIEKMTDDSSEGCKKVKRIYMEEVV